jgi:solute carrier family 41
LVIVLFILILPLLVIICKKNPFVSETLTQGWAPVIIAMFSKFKLFDIYFFKHFPLFIIPKVSSLSGVLLDYAIKIYRILAIFQPVINGVGGNIVAIYASRLSTALHQTSHIGKWAAWAPKNFIHYFIDACYGKISIVNYLVITIV